MIRYMDGPVSVLYDDEGGYKMEFISPSHEIMAAVCMMPAKSGETPSQLVLVHVVGAEPEIVNEMASAFDNGASDVGG